MMTDMANKIVTFDLAIIARGMGVEFFIAIPFTTLDAMLTSGEGIKIKERLVWEML